MPSFHMLASRLTEMVLADRRRTENIYIFIATDLEKADDGETDPQPYCATHVRDELNLLETADSSHHEVDKKATIML